MSRLSGINGRALNALDSDLAFSGENLRPFFTIQNFDDSEEVEKWFDKTVKFCESYYADLFQVQLDNLMLFRGIQWLTQERYANSFSERIFLNNRRGPRVVFNHTQDAVEHWVSKLTRYRPAVNIFPATSDSEAQDKAYTCKDVLDYIWYQNRVDEKNAQLVRNTKVMGECFRFIEWDPHKGEIHPDWKTQAGNNQRTPVLGVNGEPIMTTDGKPMYIQECVRVGEVTHNIWPGYHVFEMPCQRREDIDWAIRWKPVHVDTLRAEYPDLADKINADNGFDIFRNYGVNLGKGKDEVLVYELWHRNSRFLEKGRYVKRVKGQILESTDLPYSHGELPYIYLSDIEIPNQIRGMSFIQQTFPIQHQINAIASLIYKCFVLLAHPKYIMQEGTCDIQQLINEATVVQYSDTPPTLMTQNIVPNELFGYLNKLEEVFNKLSGQYTLSTGQAPSGIRAAKALRLIEEQEDKRAYYMAIKYNNVALVEDGRMSLVTASDYYEDSDQRMARILGKNNEYRIRQFKVADIAGPYDIRIENTTALSQSPAARIEEINEIANIRLPPDSVISREQYLRLSDLGALDELKDVATRSYACAKAENDDMRSGVEVADPTSFEDLIVHWKIHLQDMQSWTFKNTLVPERQAAYEKHMYITEFLMYEKAFGLTAPPTIPGMPGQLVRMPNPVFQQSLMMQCPQWPVVFNIPAPGVLPQPMMEPMMAAGAPIMDGPVPNGLQQAPLDAGMDMDQGAPTGTPPSNLAQAPIQ